MFNDIHGLTSERSARLTFLTEQSFPLLDQERGVEAVQRFLRDQGASVMDSVIVTRGLLGVSLGTAKEIVLLSPARTIELKEHQRLVERMEEES